MMVMVRRETLGLSRYQGHDYVGNQEINVPIDLVSRACNYPGCQHKTFIWDKPFCTQCIVKLEREYPWLSG